MITATTWVPRGHAAQHPDRYQFDEEEYSRIAKLAKLKLDDANEELEEAQNGKAESDGSVDMDGGVALNNDKSKVEEDMEYGLHDVLLSDKTNLPMQRHR
jgi:periodic tryptophan protein 1